MQRLMRTLGDVKRREFIALVGSAAAWPLAAHAQAPNEVRRIGILLSPAHTDPEGHARIAAFQQGLQDLGWMEGRNISFEYRWAAGDAERMRADAKDLVALNLDVILAVATTALVALQQATRTIPIVFAQVTDPVAAGSLRAWRDLVETSPD
jgi:putative ABC transport system substrate-binding protein